ncbi:MAG TPA: SHOCT domain-containing protein [Sulfurovum sp.]|nr:SHOCT domain-containing protein [Sulfurovum sp.]
MKKNYNIKYLIGIVLFALIVTGCGTSKVLALGNSTYMVSSDGAGFSSHKEKQAVIEAAQKYCSERNLVMQIVTLKAENGVMGRRPPQAELVFRALSPNDPEAKKRPNISSNVTSIEILK